MEKNVFWPITEGMPWFFLTFFLMTIDPAHHIYNIQLTENVFEWNLFISKFSSADPSQSLDYMIHVKVEQGKDRPYKNTNLQQQVL